MFNTTKFINAELTIIAEEGTTRNIAIDTFNKEISCNVNNSIFPSVKLSFNTSHVLKFNKTGISTNNVEMLVEAINHNIDIFNAVYRYVTQKELIALDLFEYGKKYNITIPAFYNSFNDDLNSFVEFFNSCSASTRREIIGDHITYDHDAKMSGVISISTFVGANRYCLARCKNKCAICSHCYANSLTKQRAGLKNKLRRVHAIFTTCKLSAADIPIIDADIYKYFRFEAFGDLNNKLQVKNYNLFAVVNSGVNFTLWTKNPGIIQAAINDGLQLADNLVIGLSSLYLNTPDIKTARKYPFIRFLFTVYDDDYINAHNVKINCGARHCISCGICYDYLHKYGNTGDLYIINERLK